MNKILNLKSATRLAVCLTVLLVVGCDKNLDTLRMQAVCDGGFSSPKTSQVFIRNGVISWANPVIERNQLVTSDYTYRKMAVGEICTKDKTGN